MFNLHNDTEHESGIIVYEDNAVGVFNWCSLSCDGDNRVPMLLPFGIPINWPRDVDEEAELVHIGSVDDVRKYLPGSVFLKDGVLTTDMEIIYDRSGDIPGLFGFGPCADSYKDREKPYSGDIWEIPGGGKVITISEWA